MPCWIQGAGPRHVSCCHIATMQWHDVSCSPLISTSGFSAVQYSTVQFSTVQWHEVSCSPLISTSAQLWYLHLAAAQKLRQPEEILTCNLSASEIWARTFCGLHYYNWEIPWSLDLYFPFKFHSFLTDQNPLIKFIKALHYFCIFYLFLAQCLKTSDKSCMTHAPR